MSGRRFAVIGNPVAHSLSPQIHAAFAEATGIELSYDAVCAPLDGFEATLRTFFAAADAGGVNVTVPFKERAYAMVDEHDRLAGRAGAVNTVAVRDARLVGFNTDGLGLVADLAGQGVPIDGARLLLLGAGGAVRGVLQPLLDAGVAEVQILNRTSARAAALLRHVDDPRVRAVDAARLTAAEVIINGTSASLRGRLPELPAARIGGAFCYDLAYGEAPTAFCAWAARHGARGVSDGLGMLVEQAAEAFRIWHGVRPETEPVLARLRRR